MKKVVLIEDDVWLAESYANILRKGGYKLILTRSPDEAMRLIDIEKPDVLVADVLLDERTIVPLLHELQTYDDTRVIPVILCTGLDHPALSAERLHVYGVVSVLQKGRLTPEGLLFAVAEAAA